MAPSPNASSTKKAANKSKLNCVKCKRSTKTIPSNKEGSVQCRVCDLWWHQSCADISQEVYDHLVASKEFVGEAVWRCSSCKAASNKLDKLVQAINARVTDAEAHILDNKTAIDRNDATIQTLNAKVAKLEENVRTLQSNPASGAGSSLLEEMSDRASRDRNLIIYGMEEPADDTPDDLTPLLPSLSLQSSVSQSVITTRRLGRKLPNKPRPMVAVMKDRSSRDLILEKAPLLSRTSNPVLKKVSIKTDLTKRQRELERDLNGQAAQRNLSLTQDEISKNGVWKVLGRRGEKRLARKELRPGERLEENGKVTWEKRTAASKRDRAEANLMSPTNRSPLHKAMRDESHQELQENIMVQEQSATQQEQQPSKQDNLEQPPGEVVTTSA